MGECNGRCPPPSPTLPARTSSRTRAGRVIYVGQGQEPAQPGAVELLRPPACSERTVQMVSTADSVEWIEVRNEVEALFLEFNLIKKHRPRFNIRLKDDKSYPVPRGHPRRGVAAGDGDARVEAQGRPLLRPVRPRLRDPRDARPPAAHVPDPHVHQEQVRPPRTASAARASTRTSRSASAPCVGAVDHRRVHAARRRADRLPRRRARRRSSTGSTSGCTRRSDDAGVRAGGTAARPDRLGAQGDRAPADGRRQGGGLRPHRDRRGPARGVGAGLLRAQGPRRRPQGSRRRQGRGRRPPGARRSPPRAALRRRSTGDDIPREILVPDRARGSASSTRSSSRLQRGSKVRVRVPAAGREARSCWRPSRRTRTRRSARHKLKRASDHNARARALVALQEALDLPEAPLRIECFDISNLQGTEIVASMVVMEDGLPKRSDYRRFKMKSPDRARTTSRRWKRCSPAASAATSHERDEGARERQAVRVPAEPAADRRRQGPARRRGARARGARARGHLRSPASPSASRRSTCPGQSGPGAHPARLRGAVPAPAGARRGPPVRDHVPPPAAGQEA